MVRGVLVAGGRGTRLGAHKARVAIAGVSLLQRALETLSRVADDLVVAAPESLALRLPESPRARRVFDRVDGEGPLAGAVAALEDGGFEMAVILGVDFPLMHAATLRALIARLEAIPSWGRSCRRLEAGSSLWRPRMDERLRPRSSRRSRRVSVRS